MGTLKPGFGALARRAGVPLLPVGIDGAFDSWPRSQILPAPAVIHIQFGEPLGPDEIAKLDDRALVAEMDRRIRDCHARAREFRMRAAGIEFRAAVPALAIARSEPETLRPASA